MPFNEITRGSDKNVSKQGQNKRSTDYTRQLYDQRRMEKLTEQAQLSASSSTNNERTEAYQVLEQRAGHTAKDSKIRLTNRGLIGGMENEENWSWFKDKLTTPERRQKMEKQGREDMEQRHAKERNEHWTPGKAKDQSAYEMEQRHKREKGD